MAQWVNWRMGVRGRTVFIVILSCFVIFLCNVIDDRSSYTLLSMKRWSILMGGCKHGASKLIIDSSYRLFTFAVRGN